MMTVDNYIKHVYVAIIRGGRDCGNLNFPKVRKRARKTFLLRSIIPSDMLPADFAHAFFFFRQLLYEFFTASLCLLPLSIHESNILSIHIESVVLQLVVALAGAA